jgi:UDP:flavonoid glycosyltransferase YjiC (YdhE family)
MNIVIFAFGSRGDVQPCIALALGLQHAGHRVTLAAGDNFEKWVCSYGLGFAKIGVDIQAMMQSPEGIAWVEASSFMQPAHMRRLFKPVGTTLCQAMWNASENADLLISSFTCDGPAMTIAKKRGIKWATLSLQPLRPTRNGAATFFAPLPKSESVVNWLVGKLSAQMLWRVFGDIHNDFRRELGFAPQTPNQFYEDVSQVVALNGYSRHVVSKPKDWPSNWHLTGYWFLDEPNWLPPPELVRFITSGEKPIYIGFGSATDSDAQATTQMIARAVASAKCRAIVFGGWAGLSSTQTNEDIYFLRSGVPHSWLFPLMAGAAHHGGAGTTAAAFRSGIPQFVVPHFAEQPYWGRRTHELGVGAKPIDKRKLSAEKLADALRQLLNDAPLRQNAVALGEKIRAEDGVANAVEIIQSKIDPL